MDSLSFAKGGTAIEEIEPGAYVTDGVGLFRVLSVTARAGTDTVATVEDCASLQILVWTLAEMKDAAIELVREGGERSD